MLTASAGAQQAASADPVAEQYFANGIELEAAHKFDEAAEEFRKAFERTPHPVSLCNHAIMLWKAGRFVEATHAVKRFFDTFGTTADTESRTKAEALQRNLWKKVAYLTINVVPDGAEITVDGDVVGRSPLGDPVPVLIGSRVIAVRLPAQHGSEPVTRKVTVIPNKLNTVEIQIEVRVEPGPRSSGPGVWPWIATGVSAAVVITGGALLAASQSDISRVEEAPRGTQWDDVEDAHDNVPAMSAAGAVLLGVGIAGATASVLWAIVGAEDEAPPHVSPSVSGLVVRGAF